MAGRIEKKISAIKAVLELTDGRGHRLTLKQAKELVEDLVPHMFEGDNDQAALKFIQDRLYTDAPDIFWSWLDAVDILKSIKGFYVSLVDPAIRIAELERQVAALKADRLEDGRLYDQRESSLQTIIDNMTKERQQTSENNQMWIASLRQEHSREVSNLEGQIEALTDVIRILTGKTDYFNS